MGAVAAAAIIHKEKEIVETFRAANALTPDGARTPGALGVHEGLAFRKLREHAVLRETEGGRLYLDEPSWQALRAIRHRFAFVILTLVLIVGAMAFLIAGR